MVSCESVKLQESYSKCKSKCKLKRNPFCYGKPKEDVECLAICKLNAEYFALLECNSKCYKVKSGDKLECYKVNNINDNALDLIDNSGNKKALQLK